MNEIVRRSILAMAMTLAVLGGLGVAAAHTAPGLALMTPPGASVLRDEVHAETIHRLPTATPSPRPGHR